MNKLFRITGCLALMLMTAATTYAQTTPDPIDVMRSNGKIYVVVAIVVTILLGVLVYLFSLDRKISRIEKNNKK